MRKHYTVLGAVLKSISDAVDEGGEPPFRIVMSKKNKEIFDQEAEDSACYSEVVFALSSASIFVDEDCSDDEVYATLPVH
ncbi:hypothetical protein [Motilimonas eburnea]|uniref:hypothetical protein n=1 Tax=Motilimonas eburnea TaxID=1737488 RepID=UPI001E313751|nr:hypothetical protein [Motilimonas eburnea]MCE2571840.1 hypothetical protein [Motilimonas eburnea]